MYNTLLTKFVDSLAFCMRTCVKTLVTALLVMTSFTSLAQTTGWLSAPEHPPVKMRMMSTGEQSDDGSQIQTVLDVVLDGDWKTYWRSPGEGGIPQAGTGLIQQTLSR